MLNAACQPRDRRLVRSYEQAERRLMLALDKILVLDNNLEKGASTVSYPNTSHATRRPSLVPTMS